MTDQSYADLRAALESGPTPGPRRVSDDGLRVLDDTGGELMSRCPGGCSALRPERDNQQRANVMLAAAAGPDTIRALLADYDRLRDALEWYSSMSKEMGNAAIHQDSQAMLTLMKEIAVDYGKRARAALAQEQS